MENNVLEFSDYVEKQRKEFLSKSIMRRNKKVLTELLNTLKFNETGYPKSDIGYQMFLNSLGIELFVFKPKGSDTWCYQGVVNHDKGVTNFINNDIVIKDGKPQICSHDTFKESFIEGLIKCLEQMVK